MDENEQDRKETTRSTLRFLVLAKNLDVELIFVL